MFYFDDYCTILFLGGENIKADNGNDIPTTVNSEVTICRCYSLAVKLCYVDLMPHTILESNNKLAIKSVIHYKH